MTRPCIFALLLAAPAASAAPAGAAGESPACPREVLSALSDLKVQEGVREEMERWLDEACGPERNCCMPRHGCYGYKLEEPSCSPYERALSNAVSVEGGKIFRVRLGRQVFTDASGSIDRELYIPAEGPPAVFSPGAPEQQGKVLAEVSRLFGPLFTLDAMARGGQFVFGVDVSWGRPCLTASAAPSHPFLRGTVSACGRKVKDPMRLVPGMMGWDKAHKLALAEAARLAGGGTLMQKPEKPESWNRAHHANTPFSFAGGNKGKFYYGFAFRVYDRGEEYNLLVKVDASSGRSGGKRVKNIGSRAGAELETEAMGYR